MSAFEQDRLGPKSEQALCLVFGLAFVSGRRSAEQGRGLQEVRRDESRQRKQLLRQRRLRVFLKQAAAAG